MNGTRQRHLFLAAVLFLAGGLSFEAGKQWLADHWARSRHKEDWVRAVELEPANANYWYRLGRLRELNLEHPDLNQAFFAYQRAAEINPRSASYWLTLARVYEMRGEPELGREALEKGRSAYPISPEVAWHYGNFLLRQGQLCAGFAEIRRALAVDPNLTTLAMPLCWRASGDIKRILDEALPPARNVYFQALRYFLSQQEVDAALAVWNRLLTFGQPLELQRAFPLLEVLLQQGRISQAREVWQQALAAASFEVRKPADDSLVWNGGFEREFVNGGFGWRQRNVAGASFEFDTGTYRAGMRSLRVTFDGTANLNFEHLVQYVPVEPRSRYRFLAFLHTEGISTDSGLRFRLFDPQRPAAMEILTPNLVGSESWSPQEAEFTTGPETRLLAIVLRRIPTRKFDNKLRGRVWVDAVALTPVKSSSMPPPP